MEPGKPRKQSFRERSPEYGAPLLAFYLLFGIGLTIQTYHQDGATVWFVILCLGCLAVFRTMCDYIREIVRQFKATKQELETKEKE